MLKIGKGLKKKKKSKKSKHKEDELFTEEELERYRKEHAHHTAENSGENSETKPTSEELEKFKQLTAGVDDILKKSQGDLDRIKKESFFQRKLTPSELKAQEEKEKEAAKQAVEEREKEEEEKEEESESEEFDDKDDIFDTTYVDVLESGEIKLAYIPDDDEIVKAGEPDPFDTTTADEILKKAEEVEKKKKLELSLEVAATVLSGRAEREKSLLAEVGAAELIEEATKTILPVGKPKKRPRKIQDVVLIGSFDESSNPVLNVGSTEAAVENVPPAPKSLLDDDLDVECPLPEGEALLTEVLVKHQSKPTENLSSNNSQEKETSSNLKDLVSEFDIIKEDVTPEVRKAEVEEEFDEFTALAASSVVNQKLEEELQKFENLEDDPFDTSTANIVLKKKSDDPFGEIDAKIPSPQTSVLNSYTQKWSAFDNEKQEEETEVDPFDTTFAEKIQPGKCELKLLESEILGDIAAHKSDVHREARILSRTNSDSDFDPRAEETPKLQNQSLLSKVSIQITDPSGFVETQRNSESEPKDGDFNSLSFRHRDLLGGSTTDLTQLGSKPLPPKVESPEEDFSKYSDPFDTSIVDQVAIPGKAELKFIEKELLSDIPKISDEDSLSDIDFDPRKEESLPQKVSFDVPYPDSGDLLSASRGEGPRPLTPYYADAKESESDSCEVDDPFDTSHVVTLPGKEEIKIIEKEFNSIQIAEPVTESVYKKLGIPEENESTTTSGLKHSLSDQDFNPREESDLNQTKLNPSPACRRFSDITGLYRQPPSSLSFQPAKPDLLVVEEEHPIKALTPAVEEDISSYIDPFDTSIAENIAPGKAELKLLESELITSEGGIKRSYTDPDFNPREEPADEKKSQKIDILNLSEESAINTKPLSPLDFEDTVNDEIDPFDTSIATNLLPGKAEIRVLESELFGQ